MNRDLLRAAGLLAIQLPDAIGFRPFTEIAMVMDEVEQRLTVVLADGSVAHRPGPLSADLVPGLVPLAPGVLAAPAHAHKKRDGLLFPGGWRLPSPTRLGKPTAAPPLEDHPLEIADTTVPVSRLRAFSSEGTGYRVLLDDGTALFIRYKAAQRLIAELGLPDLRWLQPVTALHRSLYAFGLRDFPYVLLDATSEQLQDTFHHDERTCIANLIWERPRRKARGLPPLDYGTEHRGFYYRPVLPVLNRLGLIKATVLSLLGGYEDPHFTLYGRILSDMIGNDHRLVTLRDLGFAPQRPDLRTLGAVHPDVLVVCEKESLHAEATLLGETFGVSLIVLGGMARWEATEPLADMLRPALGGRPVRIVSYCDYDPDGWEIAETVVTQLARYDIPATVVGYVVRPDRFTRKEIDMLAEPLSTRGSNAAKAEAWMKRTHGIAGQPLRIHADHLRPARRVVEAFRAETGISEITCDRAAPYVWPDSALDGFVVLRRGLRYRFWPRDEVAMIREEGGTGRLEVTSADGEVGHLVGTLSEHAGPPWVAVSPTTLVNPAHVTREENLLHLPGGWTVPFEGRLPLAAPSSPRPRSVDGTDLPADDVLELVTEGGRIHWITRTGKRECPFSCDEAMRRHGDLVHAGHRIINRRRVRGLDPGTRSQVLVLDDGDRIHVRQPLPRLRQALGLPALAADEHLSEEHRMMFTLELRDFPFELLDATPDQLLDVYDGKVGRLIGQILWQAVRLRRVGGADTYGRTLRGFWYRPLLPILRRAGHVLDEGPSPLGPRPANRHRRFTQEQLYHDYQRACLDLIGHYHLFRYSDLGFDDHRPDLRSVGARRPELVILTEKVALAPIVQQLAEKHGASFQVFHGQPKLLDSERLAALLQPVSKRPLRIAAFVDYDYSGWIIARAFADQLRLYGLEVSSVDFLCTPSRFSKEEIAALSYPIQATAQQATKLQHWIDETGGIDGQARGLHADHLLPLERVDRALRDVLHLP